MFSDDEEAAERRKEKALHLLSFALAAAALQKNTDTNHEYLSPRTCHENQAKIKDDKSS
jgi:hypothetical protein